MHPHPIAPIDITSAQWRILCELLQRLLPGYTVWAFGSRARWTAKPHSDLDLAIIGEQALDWRLSAELAEALAESDLPFKVDIVDWASTSPAFRQIIAQDKVVLQEAPT